MSHVLAGCPVALQQGHYTWRHDSVLNKIASFIKSDDSSVSVFCDANPRPWTIPPDILPTSCWPDLVVISKQKKLISILELTVPYENNIQKEHEYKCQKYTHLAIDLTNCGYKVKFFAVEIGSRGLISKANSNRLCAFYHSIHGSHFNAKDFRCLKRSLTKIAITASFIIYKARFQPTWCSTALLTNL